MADLEGVLEPAVGILGKASPHHTILSQSTLEDQEIRRIQRLLCDNVYISASLMVSNASPEYL